MPDSTMHSRHLVLSLVLALTACEKFDPPGGGAPGSTPATTPGGDSPQAPTASPGASGSDTGSSDGSISQPDNANGDEAAAARPDFLLGQAGGEHVFVPNPDEGSVTVIEAQDLTVTRVRAGRKPTLVGAHPAQDLAVAIDIDGDRAYLIDGRDPEASPPSVAVPRGLNAIAVHPAASHAVLYYDKRYASPTGIAEQPDVISVVRLGNKLEQHSINVQQAPQTVAFSDDGERAYVIGQRGVSRLVLDDVDEGNVTTSSPWDFDRLADANDVLWALATDGDVALVSLRGLPELLLVELSTRKIRRLAIPDLDSIRTFIAELGDDAGTLMDDALTPAAIAVSGDGAHAMLALPAIDALVHIALPEAFEDGASKLFTDVGMSQDPRLFVSTGGTLAILVDNANDPPRMTSLELTSEETSLREQALNAVVTDAWFDASEDIFVATHNDQDSGVFGYTVSKPRDGLTRFQRSPLPVADLLLSDRASAVFNLRRPPEARPILEQVDFDRLALTEHELPADARYLSEARSAKRIAVHHAHPVGRMTSFDWHRDRTRDLTGFQLVDRVKE